MAEKRIMTVGGHGGQAFQDYQVPANGKLREIRLLAKPYVNAIQLIYTDEKGTIAELRPVGGLNGELHIFTLAEDEYLTGISGTYGWYIDSIRFHTNKRVSDTYGPETGEIHYKLEAPSGEEIVGFAGRADWYIDQIGIITRKIAKTAKAAPKPKAAAKGKPAPKAAPAKKKAAKKADLTIIEGIGPKLASILADAGIPDLATLAKTEVKKLQEVIEKAGRRFNLADPATWPEQAALAAKEAWDALEKLQNQLKGGRRS